MNGRVREDIPGYAGLEIKVFDKYGDHMHAASPNTEGDGITIERTKRDGARGPTAAEMTAVASTPVTIEITDPPEAASG